MAIGAAWGATLGRRFPAMTLVQISAPIDPNAKVEIEAEAILPEPPKITAAAQDHVGTVFSADREEISRSASFDHSIRTGE